MINHISSCKKLKHQAPKSQEPQDMKATRHEMYMCMLGLKQAHETSDGRHARHMRHESTWARGT